MLLSTTSPWFLTRALSSAWLEALKMSASIGTPGADGGAVEFWISGGGGVGSLSKRPPSGPSSQTTVNLLAQWKVSLGMVAVEKKMALYETPRRVTWAWCVTRRFSNHCNGSAFGKYTLTNADGHSFLRSTEHCAPWTRRSRRHIKEYVRNMFGGRGVSNDEKILYRNFWYNPT